MNERTLMQQMDTVTLGRHQLELAAKAADFQRKARHYQGLADTAAKLLKKRATPTSGVAKVKPL